MRGTSFFLAGMLAMLAAGWFALPNALYTRTGQPIQFSHKVHTGDKGGMKCEDCHAVQADGGFAGIPSIDQCAGCHSTPMGNSPEEKKLIDNYVSPHREVPWLIYAREPDNVSFSHAVHIKLAGLSCEQCHGGQGATDRLRPLQTNRISTYSRDIYGPSAAWSGSPVRTGMRMDDCVRCHRERGVVTGCLGCHQ